MILFALCILVALIATTTATASEVGLIGRFGWYTDASLYQYYLAAFDGSGAAFGLKTPASDSNEGLGPRVSAGIALGAVRSTEAPLGHPHVFTAYLFDDATTLAAGLAVVPQLERAVAVVTFNTSNFNTDGLELSEVPLFDLNPNASYTVWVVKETEAAFNQMLFAENYCIFAAFTIGHAVAAAVPNKKQHHVVSRSQLLAAASSGSMEAPLPRGLHQRAPLTRASWGHPQPGTGWNGNGGDGVRRIEFIGDSITAGYCNLCEEPWVTPETFYSREAFTKSWAFLAAQHFEAQYHTLAWSGRGMYRNVDLVGVPYPDVYPHTLASSATSPRTQLPPNLYGGTGLWNFSRAFSQTAGAPDGFYPDVVVVNLGSNDHVNASEPTVVSDYMAAYRQFLTNLTAAYLDAANGGAFAPPLSGKQQQRRRLSGDASGARLEVLIACGPIKSIMGYCPYAQQVASWAEAAIAPQYDARVRFSFFDFGAITDEADLCCSHPNVNGDRSMARTAIAAIRNVTGW